MYSNAKKMNSGFLGTVLLLALASSANADIYAYTDENGVRHISNQPTDSRYKLIMRTPQYQQPSAPQIQAATAQANPRNSVAKPNGSSWKVIRPSSDRRSSLAKLRRSGHIEWSSGGKKPFAINESNRRRFTRAIEKIAAEHRLDPQLIHAVISAESAFNPRAVSRAGAMGLMQLMPGTAERFGVKNPFDPIANINGGARYLRWLLNRFQNNLRLALAGYNAGENAVIKYGKKIPPYKETQTYVKRVLKFYSQYKNGADRRS